MGADMRFIIVYQVAPLKLITENKQFKQKKCRRQIPYNFTLLIWPCKWDALVHNLPLVTPMALTRNGHYFREPAYQPGRSLSI